MSCLQIHINCKLNLKKKKIKIKSYVKTIKKKTFKFTNSILASELFI